MKKIDQSDVYAMNMVQTEDMKKKIKILELKLQNAESSKIPAKKLIQKNEEIEELKKTVKQLEEKMKELRNDNAKLSVN